MSEETIKTPSKRRYLWLALTIIILVGAGGYFVSQTGLDKALVKQALDQFAEDLKTSTESSPAQMRFTYDDVRITGGFTNRHAIIVNPRFTETTVGNSEVTLYRTAEILVHPTSADMKSLKIEAAKPIEMFSDAEATALVAKITPKTAILVTIAPEEKDEKTYKRQTILLPDAFLIDGPADKAADPWNTLTLTLASGGRITRAIQAENEDWTSPGDSAITLKDIKITPDAAPEDAITIETIDGSFTNILNDKKLNLVNTQLTFGPIVSSPAVLPYGPIQMDMKLAFEGILDRAPEAFADAKSTDSSLKITTLAIKAKDAGIFVTADFIANAADMLPVGTANITIENAQFILTEMRKHGALRDRDEHVLAAVVERATGKPLAENKDISIDIKRVRDGAFQIGKSTFEEIMATVLGSALGREVPATPSAPAPKPMPAPEKIITPATQG